MAARVIAFAAEAGSLSEEFERFVLIHLPLQRAEQYYHALIKRQGWRTYAPLQPVDLRGDDAGNSAVADDTRELPPLTDDPDLAEAIRRMNLDKP